jgi:polysaccharide pyruvyl transferase WcaK-like protein
MHSPIIAFHEGTPAIYLRQPTDSRKGQMWRDVGLSDWLFEIDSTSGSQIADALMSIHKDYSSAEEKMSNSKKLITSKQMTSMGHLKKLLYEK